MNKATLRKNYLERRKQLTPSDINELSTGILNLFKTLNFSGIHYLHTFYPIAGKHEFNSLLLANWISENHPEIKLVLPKSNLLNHSLEHIIWTPETPLAMNEWGITEPEHGEVVEPNLLDMVIVPLLVFDKKGNRIGYGKGFYDRFLTECRKDVIKVGISFFDPENEFYDVNEFDIPLDICITPDRIWDFKHLSQHL